VTSMSTDIVSGDSGVQVSSQARPSSSDPGVFLKRAVELVVDNFNTHRKPDRSPALTNEGVYMAWFTYALMSTRAVFMSPIARGLLWEVTYNRKKNELYLDVYGKLNGVRVPMDSAA
jgi:hypothetical protein